MSSVRTRFAPSPTGALHVGNARAAVFNWLFARHHGGVFILRIEDTDPERNVEGAEEAIAEDLRWLGLHWDEGPGRGGEHGPYRQSLRSRLYREHARRLLGEGKAYRCFCGPGSAEGPEGEDGDGGAGEDPGGAGAGPAGGDPTGTPAPPCPCDGIPPAEAARREEEGEPTSLRFRVPGEDVEVKDEVKGVISFSPSDFGDFVILRSDGRPTYNFAVVVDDALMEVSHVIRGVGHLSNTPKQLLLYRALGFPEPRFAHLPTVLAEDRSKLSKRAGARPLSWYREEGYHPDAVVNHLSLLGWSHPEEEEVLSREDLVAAIGFERVGTSDTVFDEEKLRWLSSRHIQAMEGETLARALERYLDRERIPLEGERLRIAAEAARPRISTFREANDVLGPLFPEPGSGIEEVRRRIADDDEAVAVIRAVREELEGVEEWRPEPLDRAVRAGGEAAGAKGAALFHPVRRAITGEESGPSLGAILGAVGRRESLRRLGEVLGSGEA